MSHFSPLRYPGGKGKLAPYLSEIIELNALQGGHYAEPYAGGAAVALDLLFSERVRHIHINDIDPCVYAFWHSVVHETETIVRKIQETEVTVDAWLKAREVKRAPDSHSPTELGFATFLLSRTNRSGILNGGVIGGLDQTGPWKMDCRYNKEELISRIRRIGFFRSRISVMNFDAAHFLSNCSKNLPKKSFLYIDPPYYVKGAYLYENHYGHSDHVKLSKIVSKIKCHKWIVSYDNAPEISDMYQSFEQQNFSIDYTARNYASGSEIMIFSPKLRRPAAIYSSQRQLRALSA